MDITGSFITGTNENSNIVINGKGNVDIKNANYIKFTSYYSDKRGNNREDEGLIFDYNIMYKF